MRTHSQKITVERLAKALERQGVSLKRHQLIEVLAHTFGLVDSNDLAAVAKRGEIDPPVADDLGVMMTTHPTRGNVPLALLRDPTDDRVFALDAGCLDPTVKADRFVVSPYGGILSLPTSEPIDKEQIVELLRLFAQPDRMPDGQEPTPPAERRISLIDTSKSIPAEYAHLDFLLSNESFDVDVGPILYLTPRNIAIVDGETFLAFEFDEEYPDHEQATYLLRDLEAFRIEHGTRIERAGGILRWTDVHHHGRVEVQILMPARLAEHVEDAKDWWDAIALLLGSTRVDGCQARFHPQAWQNDWAVDVDPKGEVLYDVGFEILLMDREQARAIRDNKDESDDLMTAVHAPEWIRTWDNAFRIEVANEIESFLDARALTYRDEAVRDETTVFRAQLEMAASLHAAEIDEIAARMDGDDDIGLELDEIADEIKGMLGSKAANHLGDVDSEHTIDLAEDWVTDNVSNAADETRIAAAFAALGRDEALRRLAPKTADDQPPIGTAAAMPDGVTTIVVDRAIRAVDGGWLVADQYGEEHVVANDGASWEVVVPGI
jgi:hypothetical protein